MSFNVFKRVDERIVSTLVIQLFQVNKSIWNYWLLFNDPERIYIFYVPIRISIWKKIVFPLKKYLYTDVISLCCCRIIITRKCVESLFTLTCV